MIEAVNNCESKKLLRRECMQCNVFKTALTNQALCLRGSEINRKIFNLQFKAPNQILTCQIFNLLEFVFNY